MEDYIKMLSETPEEERTEELCLKAVKQHGLAIKLVPKDKRTKEICLEALRKYAGAVFEIPKEMRTEELYLKAVQEYGPNLGFVPKDKRTEAICLEAVKANDSALIYVPEEIRPLITQKYEEFKAKYERRKSYAEEIGVDVDTLSEAEKERLDKEIEEVEERKKLVKQIFDKRETIKAQEERKQELRDSIEPDMPNIGD